MEAVPTPTTATLAELFSLWRQTRGWSQRMLAIRSGINNATLSRWEAGRTLPRLSELDAVMDALQLGLPQRQQAMNAWRAAGRRTAAPVLKSAHAAAPENAIPPAVIAAAAIREPITGDLLRALRQRQGRSQSEVAHAIGVRQSTIARWEEGGSAPETAQLSALCVFLQPEQAELAALASGYFCASETDPQTVARPIEHLPIGDDLFDLRMLSRLEAFHRLPWQNDREATENYFAALYAYARDLLYLGRLREARRYLTRAEALFSLLAQTLGAYRKRRYQEIQATLRTLLLAEQSIYGATVSTTQGMQITLNRQATIPRHRYSGAAKQLRTLLPDITDLETRSWILMHLSRYVYGLGDAPQAIAYAEQSWRILTEDWLRIEQHPPSIQRRILHARLLVRVGRWEEAAMLLPTVEQQARAWYTLPGDVNYALTAQAWAEVHTAKGEDADAETCRVQAVRSAPRFMERWVQ